MATVAPGSVDDARLLFGSTVWALVDNEWIYEAPAPTRARVPIHECVAKV